MTPSMPSKSRNVDDFLGFQLKNVKILEFKGAEKDRNKDAVHTFIQKWMDIHDLQATPDKARPKETSLSLKGKAYKWWMAMNYNTHPKSWKDFQDLFCNEFLPKNEKQKNWNSWDACCMAGNTLTQYISKYREAILKLEGLDEFQKLRGFL